MFFNHSTNSNTGYEQPTNEIHNTPLQSTETPFHELELSEQIKQSSVIALLKYEQATDGKRHAVIKEFLKKSPGTEIYYAVGDEYKHSSYYPNAGTNYGDGLVIFFVGSPAQMRLSMSFEGDRIRGLGDLPVNLLREKCNESI